MPNRFRILLWLALLAASFFAGVAWKSKDLPAETSTEGDPTIAREVRNEPGPADNLPAARAVAATNGLTPQETATIRLFEEAAPSVCYITTSNVRTDYFTRDVTEIPRGTGSGFVWDNKGHIVTNYHVIQGADRATVTLADRSTWQAKLVGIAPEKDLAVLLIDAPGNNLSPIPIGTSEDLRVGQAVFAIGNPFGLDQTLTTGIVSALGREIESVAGIPIRDVIQTDAAINPGNSGGPLLDSSGRLIGVNTAIYSPSGASAGIGFSIPADVVRWVVPEIIEFGKLKRPSLGVELARQQIVTRLGLEGALVIYVEEGGAAERAGIRPTTRDRYGSIQLGDIIIALNNEAIKSNNDLLLALEKFEPGDVVKVRLLRDKKEVDIQLRLDQAK
ncbi:MAG: trypsin-like peptidase domain-containing protein [Phaeodactylibacter sp.]|nr:trypsin-like peptidase domain-containing protein [Phaeodactylibacter sp.]MCB9274439.1 trypsin-like peptidase domain-containing protein [Lewinellaceae bacterium]